MTLPLISSESKRTFVLRPRGAREASKPSVFFTYCCFLRPKVLRHHSQCDVARTVDVAIDAHATGGVRAREHLGRSDVGVACSTQAARLRGERLAGFDHDRAKPDISRLRNNPWPQLSAARAERLLNGRFAITLPRASNRSRRHIVPMFAVDAITTSQCS